MKKVFFYFFIIFLLAIILFPLYIKSPKLMAGYRAYVYCKEGVCEKGYVLNVENDTLNNSSHARFLDDKDRILYQKLFKRLDYDMKDIMYVVISPKDCIENKVKTKNILKEIDFEKNFINFPELDQSNNSQKVHIKEKKKEPMCKKKALCDLQVIASKERVNTFGYLFRYLLYKLA